MASNFSLNVKINGVEQAVSSVGEIEAALKATRQELKGVEIDSSAFAELSNQARKLQDQLKESFKEATNFDKNLNKLGQSVARIGSTVAASFSLVTSAFQVFGGESEELTQAQIKAQQSLAIAFAATTIAMNAQKLAGDLKLVTDRLSLGIQGLLTAAVGKDTVAKAANAAATGTATIAQRALNAAMAANPILLIVGAIATLTAAYFAFSESAEEVDLAIDEFNSSLIDSTKAIRANKEEINSLINSLIDLRIAEEKDVEKQKELIKLRDQNNKKFIEDQIAINQSLVEKSIQSLEDFQVKSGALSDEFFKDRLKFADNLLGIQLNALIDEQALRDDRLRDIEIENLEEQQLLNEHYLKLVDIQETYLKNQGLLEVDGYKEKIDILRKNLQDSINLIEKDLATRIKLNIDGNKKQTDEDNKETQRQKAELEKRKQAWKKSYDDIKKVVSDTFKELTSIEDNYYDKIQDLRFENGLEAVEYQEIVELQKLEQLRKTFSEELKLSVLSNEEKIKSQLEFEELYKESESRIVEFFSIKKDEEVKILKARADEIKFIYDTLFKEITVGDQNLTNQLDTLLIRQKEVAIQELQLENDLNRSKLQIRTQNLEQIRDLQIENNDALLKLNEDLAEAERLQQLQNTKQLYKDKFGIEFFETKEGAAILEQLELNLEAEKQVKLQEIRQKFKEDELAIERELTDEKLKLVQEFIDFVTSSATIALDLFSSLVDLAKTNRENELIDLRNANDERLNVVNEQYNAELQAQQTALDRGLINQQQYNSAILALDTGRIQKQSELEQKLRDEELKAKKKSFEEEKKLRIASTIISGIQGAFDALAGMVATFPGPLGFVLGGIASAAVAATTGIQVAAIKKQKFDSSGSVNITPANPSGGGPIGGSNIAASGSSGGFTQFNESLVGTPTNSSGVSDPSGGGPTKVYVLESDITSTQNRVSVAELSGTIG
jgi:hypothetical protein